MWMHRMVLFLTPIGAEDLVIAATPYYAVVDAGSGGSGLDLYRVNLNVQASPQITDVGAVMETAVIHHAYFCTPKLATI